MEQEKQNLAPGDAEKTVVSPRFDEDAISHARPAVPLDEADAATATSQLRQAVNELSSSRLALALVLISMLASGITGALATMLYHRHSAPPAAAQSSSSATNETAGIGPEDARGGDASLTGQRTAPVVAEADNPALVKTKGIEEEMQASLEEHENQRSSLRAALDQWIATTNARDINRQKDFYMPKVDTFYRARNVSREVVLADKGRAFENADLIDVRAGRPHIDIHPDGTATMRFRKQYAIKDGEQDRRGEVLQELRWRRTDEGWKIISERDVKVLQ